MMAKPVYHIAFRNGGYLSIDIGIGGVGLDEFATRLYIITHKHGEYFVGLRSILNRHLLQQSGIGIHCCLPQLFWVHLTKTFVALGVKGCGIFIASHILIDEGLTLLFGVAVLRELLVRTLIKRWRGNIEVTLLYDFRHKAEEECHDERVDV